MAVIYQNTDIIALGSAVTTSTTPALADGDLFYLAQDADIVSTSSDGFNYTDTTIDDYGIVLHGNVIAQSDGIFFLAETDPETPHLDYSIFVAQTASISANLERGIYMGAQSRGYATGDLDVVNHGSISSMNAAAILLFYVDNQRVENTGTISSFSTETSFDNAVALFDAEFAEVTNSGTISTTASTTSFSALVIEDVAAVSIRDSNIDGVARIINSGTISGGSHSIYVQAHDATLLNTGLLVGHIKIDNDIDDFTKFNNRGGILEGRYDGDSGVDTLINTGLITDDVNLGSRNDILMGRGGTIQGVVDGGTGDDLFVIDQADISIVGGTGNDTVRAYSDFTSGGGIEVIELRGAGDFDATGDIDDNDMYGNKGHNVINGLEGLDTITAAGGNDTVLAGEGNDEVLGGVGDDLINGELDNDRLLGQAGNDEINGGNGDDTLNGGTGEDLLIGLGGKDTMLGGSGNDVFLFENTAHSGTTAATADKINDFASGDLIDIGSLIDEALVFSGTSGLIGGGTGSVAYTVTAGGTSRVAVDTDGDGTLDMMINLIGVASLSADDFIL